MSFRTTHPVSGEPLVIENPLTSQHIKVGALLWYWGSASMHSWDCPAVVTRVNKKRQFKIRSLDDMQEQDEWYSFSCTQRSSTVRQTMRIASAEEVKAYLDRSRVRLAEAISSAESELTKAKGHLADFDKFAQRIITTS